MTFEPDPSREQKEQTSLLRFIALVVTLIFLLLLVALVPNVMERLAGVRQINFRF